MGEGSKATVEFGSLHPSKRGCMTNWAHQRKHGSMNRAAKDEMLGLPLSTWYVPLVQTWHGPPWHRGRHSTTMSKMYSLYSIPLPLQKEISGVGCFVHRALLGCMVVRTE